FFYQYDGLGSVVGLTDGGGKLLGRYSYDAWGQDDLTAPEPQLGTKNKFRFTGEALDPGTGLYYLRARYYDPMLRRFLVPDPVLGPPAHPLSRQKYPYAVSNPTNMIDPSGLSPTTTSQSGLYVSAQPTSRYQLSANISSASGDIVQHVIG